MTSEEILSQLKVDEEVIAIFPYGSQVYGTAGPKSDHDFIIVTKGSVLSDGAFKHNAISNADYTVQGVLYSRGGFLNALETYEIGALECLSLPPEDIVLMTPFFEKYVWNKERKWDEKEMVKKIIQKASASRHIADQQAQTGYGERAKKGIFHAVRILMFGLQLKEHGKIVDYTVGNELYYKMKSIDPIDFDTRYYYHDFDTLTKKLRGDGKD